MDQEERPSRQDRLDLRRSRCRSSKSIRSSAGSRSVSSRPMRNPWRFSSKNIRGTNVEGEVKNKTEFGLFLGLDGDVDGMVHLLRSRLEASGRTGDRGVQEGRQGQGAGARRRRRKGAHLLGIKQLEGDPFAAEGAPATSRRAPSSPASDRREGRRSRRDHRGHRLSPPSSSARSWRATAASSGRSASPSARRSMRGSRSSTAAPARCRRRSRRSRSGGEREAIAQYGSSDLGATLGDILGTALKRKGEEDKKD